ncbi:hypothetical protein ACFCXT_10630 [Streptomyces vinaceus]|uniref:hypothetical protein n=1 Tax=Streptomyces vinaceus TaxID=1960 RepID=UPI0035D73C7F
MLRAIGQIFDVCVARQGAAFPFEVLGEGLDALLERLGAPPGLNGLVVLGFAPAVRARAARAGFMPRSVRRRCCSSVSWLKLRR